MNKRLNKIIISIRTLAVIIILISIALNPFSLGHIFSPDGAIQGIVSITLIVIFEVLIFICGILLFRNSLYIAENIRYFNPIWLYKNKKKEILLLIFTLLICLLLPEFVSRSLYSIQRGIPLFYDVEQLVYPDLYKQMVEYSPEGIDVLLIGGSVLNETAQAGTFKDFYPEFNVYGQIEDINYYNLAEDGHTSLDSYYKYKYLISKGYHFDYVIFYHGINEVRANNVPPESFSIDYNHYGFYSFVNKIFTEQTFVTKLIRKSSLVLRIAELYYNRIRVPKVPMHNPREGWTDYGDNIMSKQSFSRNLLNIIDMNKKENNGKSTLIVPIFAYYLPDNYNLDDFLKQDLGYSKERKGYAVEIWGLPHNVAKGIDAHNEVIESLEDVKVIDTSLISASIDNFYDICHFSESGRDIFVDLVMSTIYDDIYLDNSLDEKMSSF